MVYLCCLDAEYLMEKHKVFVEFFKLYLLEGITATINHLGDAVVTETDPVLKGDRKQMIQALLRIKI